MVIAQEPARPLAALNRPLAAERDHSLPSRVMTGMRVIVVVLVVALMMVRHRWLYARPKLIVSQARIQSFTLPIQRTLLQYILYSSIL